MEEPLNIPKLLEAILLQLPARDLLLSQRISQAFRDTVATSIQLQRALFVAPVAPSTGHITEQAARPILNPLFEEIAQGLGDVLAVFNGGRAYLPFTYGIGSNGKLKKRLFLIPDIPNQGGESIRLDQYVLNPVLEGFPRHKTVTYFKCGDTYINLRNTPIKTVHPNIYTMDPVKYEEFTILGICFELADVKRYFSVWDRLCTQGSWEGMYFSQPPCNVYVGMLLPWIEIGFQTETPATMGEMMRRAVKLAKHHVTEDAW